MGLAPARPPDARDLERAIGLREAIQPLAQAAAGRFDGDPADLDRAAAALGGWLEAPPPALTLGEGGRARWGQPSDTGEALALLARQAVHGLADRDAAHLGACADDECRLVYLDPEGRRRWCSNQGCGSKARVRSFRARQASAG